MNRPLIVWLIIFLALLGLADAWYLADAALNGAALSCSIAALDGCNIVAQSPYSRVFGIPLALYGVAFYATTFTLAAVLLMLRRRILDRAMLALGTAGFIASLIFLMLQILVIKALCIYCLASVAIAFLLFLATYVFWKRFARPATAVVL